MKQNIRRFRLLLACVLLATNLVKLALVLLKAAFNYCISDEPEMVKQI